MKRKKTGKNIAVFLLILILLFGALLVVYPLWTGYRQSEIVNNEVHVWREQLAPEEESSTEESEPVIMPELLEAMKAYNEHIYLDEQEDLDSVTAYEDAVIDLSEYGLEDGSVGIISIPKIDVEMSIFLGATDENLAKGFGHMGQTSLPIGGINSNFVVAGHRGWRGAPYMRDAHLLDIGDSVYLENFWEKMEYRVVNVAVIWPNDIDAILIQPGKDMLTIVTCTPYGEGYQRLLIYCERYYPEENNSGNT